MTSWKHLQIIIVLTGLPVGLLAGCASNPAANPPLPTAQVRIVHPISPTPPPSTASPATSSPTSLATPSVAPVQALALRTYGDKLIRHISLPSIGVESAVVAVGWTVTGTADPQADTAEWDSPGPDVGWVVTSGLPGTGGNVILYGHNNMYGSVFKNLWKMQPDDKISLQTGLEAQQYVVDRVLLLPVLNSNPTQKQAYLAYLAQTEQPRLTLISCWPPESNTHRVVVIAYPAMMP